MSDSTVMLAAKIAASQEPWMGIGSQVRADGWAFRWLAVGGKTASWRAVEYGSEALNQDATLAKALAAGPDLDDETTVDLLTRRLRTYGFNTEKDVMLGWTVRYDAGWGMWHYFSHECEAGAIALAWLAFSERRTGV